MIAVAGAPVIPTFGQDDRCIKGNGSFCWSWFTGHWGANFEHPLIQHILMTLVAVGIGFVIAFTLAVLAHFFGWMVKPVTFLGSLLYTIPSIAAFEILAPENGINYETVEIALVSYTLLILFTNTLAGLSGVSAEVLDAARGIGLNRRQMLVRVELPLALPTIIAGVRVATVTVISLATIVAFVIMPVGLGQPIQDGLNRQIPTEYVFGGFLCILLALVADGLLAGSQRLLTPWTRRRR